MTLPKEKGVVVQTELTVVAHAQLQKTIAADLDIPDPSPEKATAILESAEEEEKDVDGS